MSNVTSEYIAVGGNKHPGSADWDRNGSDILAFAAGLNIALWRPSVNLVQG